MRTGLLPSYHAKKELLAPGTIKFGLLVTHCTQATNWTTSDKSYDHASASTYLHEVLDSVESRLFERHSAAHQLQSVVSLRC